MERQPLALCVDWDFGGGHGGICCFRNGVAGCQYDYFGVYYFVGDKVSIHNIPFTK